MRNTRVVVADAHSTDGTPQIALSFSGRLNIGVIPGGLPSAARNAGARLAGTPYVLFIDADVELADARLVRNVVERAKRGQLHCVTTNILCKDGGFLDRLTYFGNDVFQYLSCLHRPFSTGMFMLFETQRFRELGGFDERIHFAEDYALSKQVNRRKFAIVRGGVYTTNRRFQKMGRLRVMRLFLSTAIHSGNKRFFLRDHKYWEA